MTRRSIIGACSSISSSSQEGEQDVTIPPTQILKIRSNDHDDNDENDDSEASSVSSLSEDDSSRLVSPRCPKPRAIFDRYWNAEGTTPSRKVCPPSRSLSPMSVMGDPYSFRPPYSYDSAMAFLWLEEATSKPENDADSLNTYEQTLNHCEVVPDWRVQQQRMFSPYMNAPLWMSWFKSNASAPSLFPSSSCHRGRNLSLARQVQSDSALHIKSLRSVLRQGRFSQQKATATTTSNTKHSNTHHVHFQPRIQVCSYEQPMENWAEQGWSQWFGS